MELKEFVVPQGQPMTFEVGTSPGAGSGVEYTAPHMKNQWREAPPGWLTVHPGHKVRAKTDEAAKLLEVLFAHELEG